MPRSTISPAYRSRFTLSLPGAFCCCLIAACVGPASSWGAEPNESSAIRFESHIAPLLETRCLRCHGDGKLEAGLNVRRRSLLIAGGDSGPSIVPSKPDESLLLQRIEKGDMPPADEEPLTAAQKTLIRQWIAAGAPLANAQEPPLEDRDLPTRVTDEDRRFWSFQPPRRGPLPTIRQVDRARTPVDAWIAKPLEARGLSFNPDADRATILRRLAIDLTGLAPTLDEQAEFLADDSPDAVERLLDRLLASPRYGERWGRHWLDVAGYADSDGYLAADRLRPTAWRYRDYVIQALNADLPYDQFVREQLAGDELSDWRSASELTPEMVRQLTATGFLRTASDPTYPGYTEPNEIHQVLSDTMQIFGSSLLGLTIQCARCHAHKFDPVTQRDYYSLQAIFLPALDPARWQPSEVRGIPEAPDAEVARVAQLNQQADERLGQLNAALSDSSQRFRDRRVRELLATVNANATDRFNGPAIDASWHVSFAGSGKSWKVDFAEERLNVRSIAGKPGYAMARLARPVALTGDFEIQLQIGWQSSDTEPAKNTAMQGVLVNLRDAAGNLVASAGYIDENNTARGSPLANVSLPSSPLGADVIAYHVSKHGQAVLPSDAARALPPNGAAQVHFKRGPGGIMEASCVGAPVGKTIESEAAIDTPVTLIEIEFRRYVLEPGATFEGVSVDNFELRVGAGNDRPASEIEALKVAVSVPEAKRSAEQKQLVARLGPALTLTENDFADLYPEFREERARLQREIAAEKAKKREIPRIRGLMDLDGEFPGGKILRRGDHSKPGGAVDAGVPEVFAGAASPYAPQPIGKSSGRRRGLAEWLTRPDHPLTSRVQVNRMWAQHFGRGLVPTVANFGRSGVAPTHPELLDWLATELPRREWSVKSFHRLLLSSTVFRQSSAFGAEHRELDPDNRLYGAYTPRRYEGEAVRDNILWVAGKLNLVAGGAPAAVAPQGDGSVLNADDAAGNRRSVYLIVRRSQHLTMLDLFDTPLMEVNCPERSVSTVPLQSLALLHGPFTQQNSAPLGERLYAAADTREARIDHAFRLLYGRGPTTSEAAHVDQFLNTLTLEAAGGAILPPADPKLIAAERQAWVELALALLNSNEFLYVH